jgi:hypothetical protein
MQGARESIVAYLRAKDENRPDLMHDAFDDAATLTMVVKAGTISFPPAAKGRDAITDVLVRRFGEAHEDVRTFCLASPPLPADTAFSCDWLVAMSERENRMVRVGCGRYDWLFRSDAPRRAEHLAITIEVMEALPPDCLVPITNWLSPLPYPWCPAHTMLAGAPALDGLDPIRRWISHATV